MRILLLLVVGVCLGCEEAPEPRVKSEADASKETASGEQRAAELAVDTPETSPPAESELADEIVPDRLVGPDPVAVAIVQQPIHRYAAKAVTFSPDGRLLAIGYGDGQVQLFDVEQQSTVRNWFAHNNWTFDLWFSTDGQSLWTGGGDNRVRRWDVATGELQERFEDHSDDIHGIAVTSDGRKLVSGADDRLVVVRDLMTGETSTMEGHTKQVTSIALGSSDTLIASGSRDDTARLWDLETHQHRHTLAGHTGHVMSVTFSHDGSRLLTGSNDHTARIWNVETGELLTTLDRHDGSVFTAVWLPGDAVIATGSADQNLRFIRTDDGEAIAEAALQANVADIALSPGGDLLAAATSSGNVHLFETDGESLTESVVIPPIALPEKLTPDARQQD